MEKHVISARCNRTYIDTSESNNIWISDMYKMCANTVSNLDYIRIMGNMLYNVPTGTKIKLTRVINYQGRDSVMSTYFNRSDGFAFLNMCMTQLACRANVNDAGGACSFSRSRV